MKILLKKVFLLLSLLIFGMIPIVLAADAEPADTMIVTVEGRDVTADWSLMPEADNYTLYYAYADYKGDVDMDTLGTIEMGQAKTIAAPNLPSGMIFYTAIMAHTNQGDVLSNIAQFMPFGGTVTFPESGSVLMELNDTGGVGNISIMGTKNNDGSLASISQITGDNGSGSYTLNISNDKLVSYVKDDGMTTDFAYNEDGSISLHLTQSSQRTNAASTAIKRSNDGINCNLSRDEYKKSVMQDPDFNLLVGMRAETLGFPFKLYQSIVKFAFVLDLMNLSDTDSFLGGLNFRTYLLVDEFRTIIATTREKLINELLSSYDEQCKEKEDTSSSDSSNSTSDSDIVIDTSCPIPDGAEYKQFEDSTVLIQYYLLNKQQVGSYKSWETGDDGSLYLSIEKCMNSKGQLNGWDIRYNDNKTINIAIHYKDDLKDGHQYDFYFETDSLYVDNTFKNGENTARQIWHEDGSMKTYCDYTIADARDQCTYY